MPVLAYKRGSAAPEDPQSTKKSTNPSFVKSATCKPSPLGVEHVSNSSLVQMAPAPSL